MAEKKRKSKKDKLTRSGETFSGYNKPKRTPGHATKSHAVLAKDGDEVRLIRFKARHKKNIKKGKMSAAYWADKVKW